MAKRTHKKTARKTGKAKVVRKVKRKPVRRILNVVPSPDTEKDWIAEDLISDFAPAEPAEAQAGLPVSVDLRTGRTNWWTVGDQGYTGSCVGWALADSVLRWHMVKRGYVNTNVRNRPSVRYVWMGAKETDQWTNRPSTFLEGSGTSLKAALDLVRKLGVCKESVLPFRIETDFMCLGDPSQFWSDTAKLRILWYVNLGNGILDKLVRWRKWLATQGPILTRLRVDDGFFTCDGFLDNYQSPPPYLARGHAVAIVGYTPTTFIVRNSWGTDWGNAGYAEASLAYSFAAFTEAYGTITYGVSG